MQKLSFIVTNSGTINAVANGRAYCVPKDHPNYDGIKKALVAGDADTLERLADIPKAITSFSDGDVEVRDGVVYHNGVALHNTLTDRILSLIRDGFPYKPMLLFLKNLMLNPSFRSVNELYAFLEHRGLPITEDGCFLGYKAVRADWTDKHSGKFSNVIGTVHKIARNTVDDNWRVACSSGFHVGSLEYVKGFASAGDHIVIVKVNPKDVVSVPEGENTKLRTCEYEVVSEYDYKLLMESVYMPDTLHTAQGVPASKPDGFTGYGGYGSTSHVDDDDDDDDDDWEDDDDDDDDDDDHR